MWFICFLYHHQLTGFLHTWWMIYKPLLEKYKLVIGFKNKSKQNWCSTLNLSMMLDIQLRPSPTFPLGAKKDTVWHCSTLDTKNVQFMLNWTVHVKAMGLEVNTEFNSSFLSLHISQPVLTSDSGHLALVYGVLRACAAFQNKALLNLIIHGSRVTCRPAPPENSLWPQLNTGGCAVVSQPLPKPPAEYLALTF